VEGWIIALL